MALEHATLSRKTRWLLWGGYVALWTTALVMPVSTIDSLPGSDFFEGTRYLVAKSVHISAYAVMTILSGWLKLPARFRWLLVYFLMGHGTLTEIIQLYPPLGRSGELLDVAFNNSGITIGLLLSWKWWMKADEPGPCN